MQVEDSDLVTDSSWEIQDYRVLRYVAKWKLFYSHEKWAVLKSFKLNGSALRIVFTHFKVVKSPQGLK